MSAASDSLPLAPIARPWLTATELLLLGAIWGASFLFMRVAAPEFGVFPLVEMRLGLGTLVLLPIWWLSRGHLQSRQWLSLAGIGLINTAIPFALFAWAAERAPAGVGAIANSLTVLFTALVAFLAFGERIGRRRALALLGGLCGVVVLAAGKTEGASVGLATFAGASAAFCYGIGANLVRRRIHGAPPVAIAAVTLFWSALMCAPAAVWHWPSRSISTEAWGAAILLGVLCTGLAYAFYFRLISRIGASRAVTVTYLIPLFGVGWAWWLLGETPTLSMAVAAAMILGSVALSQKAD